MSGFVDRAQLHAKAGNGGAGAVAFRREAHVDRGGPDGGDGARGGDVWLVASTNQSSLLGFRDHPFRRAEDGGHGGGKRRHGKRGTDVDVPVPVGTVVHARDGQVLCDLSGEGDRWLAAEGGRGGHGNARFLSNRRRAPAFAEQGEPGEELWFDLELKLVADVAIVGLPNVGKSTLISAVSAARPKIADYPFTTLEPHLGVVRVGTRSGRPGVDDVELVLADVPGLVEGAASGRGLGHQFLRHVERARVLLVLLDLAAPDGTSPASQLETLLTELASYQPELLARPRLVVGSRADMTAADMAATGMADGPESAAADGPESAAADGPESAAADGPEMDLTISAVTRAGLGELLSRLAVLVSAAREAAHDPAAAGRPVGDVVVHRPEPEGLSVVREGSGQWSIEGRAAARAVSFHDLTDDGALDEAVRRLRRLGVDRAMARAGAREGDEVRIGQVLFRWYRDGSDAASAAEEAEAAERSSGRRRS